MPSEQPSPYAPATWRLIIGGEADGATNMAVDQAILEAMIEGISPPTLRFYAWSPPCMTLGRSQRLSDVDQEACRAAGVDVVRRPTGGRSILHTDELTYSVALLQTDARMEGGVLEGYRRLSEALLAGLHQLGASAVQSAGRREPQAEQSPICFDIPADYEITVDDRKLVGSAQWRARGGVLQHGTLPLSGDLSRIVDYLAFSPVERENQRRQLRLRALTLEEAMGQVIPFDRVARELAAGFAQALNLILVPGELTSHERHLVAELLETVYACPDWTARL